jgi:uracil-DNA glycosylase
MVVGEAPGADEEWKLTPFVGASGQELTRMMHEAGLIRTEARITNVCQYRPFHNDISHFLETTRSKAAVKGLTTSWCGKFYGDYIAQGREELARDIRATNPQVIIALGETALWALTGESGITSWRGSLLPLHPDLVAECGCSPIVIPTYHPAAILRMWDWRAVAVRDMHRVSAYLNAPDSYSSPPYQFAIRPSLPGVMQTLNSLLKDLEHGQVRLACDIETIARHIACVGVAWSGLDAICIPLMDQGGAPYWNYDEEVAVYGRLKEVLTHPNAYVVGQNFNYDKQHFAKHWGYSPRLQFDTMLAQHTLFPGLPKALDFISSMYCHYHRYWKDELKEYHKMPNDVHQFWTYNCKDCVITWEASLALESLIDGAHLREQFNFQMMMAQHAFNTMLRGVRIDQKRRSEVASELMNAIAERETLINQVVGSPINVGSPKQMKELFYDEFGFPPIVHRKTKKPTLDDEALQKLSLKNPIIAPLVSIIAEKRSLGVFLSTFCLMPLDSDGRMRTSYNVAGTETFRFNSGENAFGSGGNLQNIPKGEEE